MSLIKKLRRRGIIHSAETMFNRIVPAWLFRFSIGEVLELDLVQLRSLASSIDQPEGNYQFETVTTENERDNLRKVTWNTVLHHTTLDDIGYAVRRTNDETIVGGVWVGVDRFLESNLGFEIDLRSEQAWLYCAYIDKSARDGGVYNRLLAKVAADVLQRGYQQMLVVIQPWNKASIHIHRKYSKRSVGRITAIRLFKLAAVFTHGSITPSKRTTTRPALDPVEITL